MALSPDGTQAAVSVNDGTNASVGSDIWVWTIAQGALTRLTFTGAATSPVWTPDGRRICYMQTGEAFCQKADGSEKALSLFMFPGLESLDSLSPDIMIATLGPPIEIRPLIKAA